MCATEGPYDGWTVWERSSDRARRAMANGCSLAGSGRSVLRIVVLAAASVAGFPRGNGGRGILAMAGRGSVGAGIRDCPALHLGLRVDGTRHTCPGRSAAAIGSGGVLPLPAEPHVRRFRSGLDRSVGGVRARQPGSDRWRGRRCPRHTSFRALLRGASPAREIRGRLRRVLPERGPLVAACARLGQATIAAGAKPRTEFVG